MVKWESSYGNRERKKTVPAVGGLSRNVIRTSTNSKNLLGKEG